MIQKFLGLSPCFLVIILLSVAQLSRSVCNEKLVSYANKNVVPQNETLSFIANKTVNNEVECKEACCESLACDIAVFYANESLEDNCKLLQCALTCAEVASNTTVIHVKKTAGKKTFVNSFS